MNFYLIAKLVRRSLIFLPVVLLISLLAPSYLNAQGVPIEFNVNMKNLIVQNEFDPDNEFVDVAGTFNNWGATLIKLNDTDNDSIYSVTVDGFTPGATIQYKFRINGQWGGREEFPGEGNNRVYTVQPDSNVINVWYNDQRLETGPPQADFQSSSADINVGELVQFTDISLGYTTHLEWRFEGGTPNTSTRNNPSVQYFQAGSYDVTLIAHDSTDQEADTLTRTDAITVTERSAADKQTYWWNERVFYEIFVRSFYDSDGDGIGDFDGLRQKLDYLNDGDPTTDSDLGIKGIWLMPIHKSPSYHGYDVTDYRSIHPDFGTMEDFKVFLEAAHERGIRVIIDFVMNHTSSEHPWFKKSAAGYPEYRDFYRWSDSPGAGSWHQRNGDYYYGYFWEGMPDLNYKNEAVKDSMFAHAQYWLQEVGVDGFRLDAVKFIYEEDGVIQNTQSTYQFWGEFNDAVKEVAPDAFSVGEAWDATEIALNYVTNDRIDYGFEFDLSSAIRTSVADGDVAPLVSQMQEVVSSYPYQQYGTFLTNHDQNRIFSELGGHVGQNKAAASIYLTLPGVPYLYYGEEVGMEGTKPDPDIRRPMQWTSGEHAGFSSIEPWKELNPNYPQFNVATQRQDSSSLFHHYKKLIQLRNDRPALRTGEYMGVPASSDSVFAFMRRGENANLLVVTNLGRSSTNNLELNIPSHILPEAELKIANIMQAGDSLTVETSSDANSTSIKGIGLQAYHTVILDLGETSNTSFEEADQQKIESFKLGQNYPNPFNPTTTISYRLANSGKVKLEVFDVTGRKVRTLVQEKQSTGEYKVTFNAEALSSGLYIYRLRQNGNQKFGRMVLLK